MYFFPDVDKRLAIIFGGGMSAGSDQRNRPDPSRRLSRGEIFTGDLMGALGSSDMSRLGVTDEEVRIFFLFHNKKRKIVFHSFPFLVRVTLQRISVTATMSRTRNTIIVLPTSFRALGVLLDAKMILACVFVSNICNYFFDVKKIFVQNLSQLFG